MKETITWKISISDGDGPFEYIIENGRQDISCEEIAEIILKILESDKPMKKVVDLI